MAVAASNVRSAVGLSQCSVSGSTAAAPVSSRAGSGLGRKAFCGESVTGSFGKGRVDFQVGESKSRRRSGSLVQPVASSLLAEIAKEIAVRFSPSLHRHVCALAACGAGLDFPGFRAPSVLLLNITNMWGC